MSNVDFTGLWKTRNGQFVRIIALTSQNIWEGDILYEDGQSSPSAWDCFGNSGNNPDLDLSERRRGTEKWPNWLNQFLGLETL